MASEHGQYVLMYDGTCAFCRAQVTRIVRMAPNLPIETRDFHEPGALEAFPSLTRVDCERAMQLVDPAGNIHAGTDAVIHLMFKSRRWRWLAPLTCIPGVKPIMRWGYARIAARRHRLGAKCDEHCVTSSPSARP